MTVSTYAVINFNRNLVSVKLTSVIRVKRYCDFLRLACIQLHTKRKEKLNVSECIHLKTIELKRTYYAVWRKFPVSNLGQ